MAINIAARGLLALGEALRRREIAPERAKEAGAANDGAEAIAGAHLEPTILAALGTGEVFGPVGDAVQFAQRRKIAPNETVRIVRQTTQRFGQPQFGPGGWLGFCNFISRI